MLGYVYMIKSAQAMVKKYTDWLTDNITLRTVDNVVEITTPFLDRNNDHIQIYLEKIGEHTILTDDGQTINELELGGCNLDSPKRKDLLTSTLNGFGVNIKNKDLFVYVTEDTFAHKKHMLIQAILSINDLFYLSSTHTKSFFLEDVTSWLVSKDIRFMPNVQIQGRSGYINTFDIAIPKSKQQQERLIKTINAPNKNNIQAAIMAFFDSRSVRDNFISCAFLNDAEKINSKDIESLNNYEIKTMFWSKRSEYEKFLVA